MSRWFLLILALSLAAIARPPPAQAPLLASGRVETKYTFYDAAGATTASAYGTAWLDFERGVLVEYDSWARATYPSSPIFDIFYQVRKGGETKTWFATFGGDGVWRCNRITFPFPTRDLLRTCTYVEEDLLGAQETWRYDCDLQGLAVSVWVLQVDGVTSQVRNAMAPFGVFPRQVINYLDTAPLPPDLDPALLVPPATVGCDFSD
jgi:hypothetical protein